MWKQIGVEVPIRVLPNAQINDRELRQSYTGVEVTARGYGDNILTRSECAEASVPPRYGGSNRGHYCNPAMDQLILTYRTSLTRADQGGAISEIAKLHATDLAMMQLYYNLSNPAVVKGLNALQDDFSGGIQPGGYYGSYFRNSHLWEWTS